MFGAFKVYIVIPRRYCYKDHVWWHYAIFDFKLIIHEKQNFYSQFKLDKSFPLDTHTKTLRIENWIESSKTKRKRRAKPV